MEGALFAKWAIERNAFRCARLMRAVGRRSEARALRLHAAALGEVREGMLPTIIEFVEERMSQHGSESQKRRL
jgi:hypothetical protein